jgi:hypothetical protein
MSKSFLLAALKRELAGVNRSAGAGDGLEIQLVVINFNEHESAVSIEADLIKVASTADVVIAELA